MSADEPPIPTRPSVTSAVSADYRLVYSNVFRYRIGTGDLILTFGRVSDRPDGTVIAEDQVSVVLSWSQLKMLSHVLSETVSGIEDELGNNIPTIPNAGFDRDVRDMAQQTLRAFNFKQTE